MIVADTDVLIDYLNDELPAADHVERELRRGRLVTTAVSRFELQVGRVEGPREERLDSLLAAVPVLDLDDVAADLAAEVRRDLLGLGLDIGMADSLIAGTTLAYGATLLTRNRRHFERIEHLSLVDLPR